MATNGASARQWLAEKGNSTPPDELLRIRNAIAAKLDKLPEGHPDEDGLLEALDVMDEWQENKKSPNPAIPSLQGGDGSEPALDTRPLTPDVEPAPSLSPADKQARFQQLLKDSKMP